MKFTMTGKKFEISDSLRQYSEKKLGKLERYFHSDAEAHVTFSKERGRHLAEVTVRSDNMYFRASESTSDMYSSIDDAADVIERKIRKNKTRLEKKLKRGAFDKAAADPAEVIDFSDLDEDSEFNIIKTKRFAIKPMTAEEAILQMNLLGHKFFVFRNQDNDDAVSVVYHRLDSGYGMIEVE